MAGKLNVRKASLGLGLLFAVWHVGWALSVVFLGSEFVTWIMSLHFVSMVVAVAPFDIVTLIIGAIGAFVCGSITGAIFAFIWNKL